MTKQSNRHIFQNRTTIITIACAAVAIAGLVVVLVLVSRNFSQSNGSSEQLQQVVEEQTGKLTEEVGEIMTLPEGTPVLMTISDKSQLTDEIFKDAENGDKILVYEDAGVLVVYRESTKEIIATGKVKSGSIENNDSNLPKGVEE